MGSKSWDHYIFFNKLDRSLVSRASITRKFKILWFSNEAGYWAVKFDTDINMPPLIPDEEENLVDR